MHSACPEVCLITDAHFHLKGAIQAGIFGYNGYLVGTAFVIFQADYGGDDNYWLVGCAAHLFLFSPPQIIPAIICSALSTLVSYGLSNILGNLAGKASGVFTFPFHIMTWVWLLGLHLHLSTWLTT